mmetsp:Transcript_12378/g.48138  ORF Transcript_12378/g.48138 Transcript_12378/m.48138 type:complete len:201 (-) Transcript_12378:1025-1627(-)
MSSAVTSSHASPELTKTNVLSRCLSSSPRASARPSASARLDDVTFTHVCATVATALCRRLPSIHRASGKPCRIIAPGVFFPLLITVAAAKRYCLRKSRPSPTPISPLPPNAGRPLPIRPLPFRLATALMSSWSADQALSPPSFGLAESPDHSPAGSSSSSFSPPSRIEPGTVKPSAASFSSRYSTSNAPRTGRRYPPDSS